MKVFAASIWGENHQFNKFLSCGDNIEVLRGEVIKQKHCGGETMWGAIFNAAENYQWDLIYHMDAFCGANSGPVEQKTLDVLCAEFLDGLKAAMPVEGIVLPLHGSLIGENNSDVEGYLLEKVREIVGDAIPVSVGLDLHANVTQKMCNNCNIITSFRTTPHLDQFETGQRASDLLQQAMTGKSAPKLQLARLPILDALDRGRTTHSNSPLPKLLKEVEAIESSGKLLQVSVHTGYPWQDSKEVGPSVAVTYNSKLSSAKDLAEATAKHFMDKIWETKDYNSISLCSIKDTMKEIELDVYKGKPLLIGEYTDNPGAGGYGDCTHLLKALLAAKLHNAVFFSLADKEAVEQCIAAGEQADITLSVGGKMDPLFSGEPLSVHGVVAAISDGVYTREGPFAHGTQGDMGPSVRLTVGGLDIILTSRASLTDDRQQLKIFGIEPEQKSVVICKGMNHFRADYEPMSSRLIHVDGRGICSHDYSIFPYKNLPRPIWPLDPVQR